MTTTWRSASARMPSSSSRPVARCCWGLDLALRVHPVVDRARHFRRQVDLLHAHVDHLDAHLLGHLGVQLLGEFRHELVALAGNDLVHVAAADLVAQTLVHALRQQVPRPVLVAGTGRVVPLHVPDPELHEGVHDQRLLLQGEVALRARVQGQDAAVELLRLFGDRQLEVQARVQVRAGDGPEAQHQGPLALVDGEDPVDQQEYRQDQDDTHQDDPKAHVTYLETVAVPAIPLSGIAPAVGVEPLAQRVVDQPAEVAGAVRRRRGPTIATPGGRAADRACCSRPRRPP